MAFKWKLTLSIKHVRQLILGALIFVLFSNLAYWVAESWSHLVGFIWGIGAAVVAFLCRAKANRVIQGNRKYYLWLAIPAILALIPMILRIRRALTAEDASWWTRLWELSPVLVGFVVPVLLLWIAYAGLEGHLESHAQSKNGEGNSDADPVSAH